MSTPSSPSSLPLVVDMSFLPSAAFPRQLGSNRQWQPEAPGEVGALQLSALEPFPRRIEAMPRSKANPEAEVQNLNLRATEALQRAHKAKIELAMRCRPGLVIQPLWEKLTALGLSDEFLSTPAQECAQSRQKAAVAERKSKAAVERKTKIEDLKSEIGINESSGVADPFEPIADKAETLEGLTVPQIRDRLLPALDGMVLSATNFFAPVSMATTRSLANTGASSS